MVEATPESPPLDPPIAARWSHRPILWDGAGTLDLGDAGSGKRIAKGLKIFHDGADARVIAQGVPGGGLSVSVTGFSGSYLSLVSDLPKPVLAELTKRRIVGVASHLGLQPTVASFYVRLNLRHGPNTETLVLQSEIGRVEEFDLGYSRLGLAPVTAAWVELIFDPGTAATIELQNLLIYHRPRAEI